MQPCDTPTTPPFELGTGPYRRVHKNLELLPSKMAGKCLTVVNQVIPKGTVTFYTGKEPVPSYTWAEVQNFTEEEKEVFFNFGYFIGDGLYEGPRTEADVEADYSYFVNHSCDPNCVSLNDEVNVAARDIQVGEELTIDYSTFEEENMYYAGKCEDIKCLCGTDDCRGTISPYDYKDEKFRKKYYPHFASHVLKKIEAYLKENEVQKV